MDDISLKTAAHHLVDFSENQHFSPKLGPETTLPWKKKTPIKTVATVGVRGCDVAMNTAKAKNG